MARCIIQLGYYTHAFNAPQPIRDELCISRDIDQKYDTENTILNNMRPDHVSGT